MDCYCRGHTRCALSFHFIQISVEFCFHATYRPPGGNASGVGSSPRSFPEDELFVVRPKTQPRRETIV